MRFTSLSATPERWRNCRCLAIFRTLFRRLVGPMVRDVSEETKRATRNSWTTEPMPRKVAVLSYTAEFSSEEFKKISRGLIPQMMEDKWFIYLYCKTLHLHRSWTGFCVYQVEFERAADKYIVRRALVNRNPTQYQATDNAYDSQLLHFLISNLLLDKRIEYPVPSKSSNGPSKGFFQFHFSGTDFPEKPPDTMPPEPRKS